MGLNDLTVYNIAERNSRINANGLAFVDEDGRTSYGEFFSLTNHIAAGLQKLSITRGDRIAIMAENSTKYMAIYFAAGYIGAIVVSVNTRLTSEEVKYILGDTSPKVIFVDEKFYDIMEIIMPKINSVTHLFSMEVADVNFTSFSEIINNDGCLKESEENDDGLVVIHSAAVDGKPRGTLLSHRNIISANMQKMYTLSLTTKDVCLINLPLYHIFGLEIAMMTFHAGGVNVIMPHFDAEKTLQYIERERVTLILDFPPILIKLLEQMEKKYYDISSLKYVLGLENQETIMKFKNKSSAQFITGSGQVETTGMITMGNVDEKPGSAGRLGPLVQAKIVDDHDNDLEIGRPGELVVKGPLVFKGYWNLSSETMFTFREGWHHTGDIGRFDEDGYFWYINRKAEKELIKSGGENVYPVEVEKVILQNPLIEEVSVIGIPDAKWGETIKAVCVLKKGAELTPEELISFVTNRIARYKKPKYIVFVPNLPKTEDGHIDRVKIKEDYGKV